MTRTDAVLAAIRAELEPWRPVLDTVPGLRCVTLVAMLDRKSTRLNSSH